MRSYSPANRHEPAIAGGRTKAGILQRPNQKLQPKPLWARIGIGENENIALGIGFGNRQAEVVDLLPAVSRRPGNHETHRRARLTGKGPSRLFDYCESRIVCGITDKDDLECGVVLCKDRVDVFFQPVVNSTTRNEDRSKGSEVGTILRQLSLQVAHKSHPATERNQTQPD